MGEPARRGQDMVDIDEESLGLLRAALSGGVSQTERITAVDAPQQEIDSRFFAIVTDLVGSPCELVDEQGDIAWRARSTLWGATTWTSDATTYTPLRFPGQYNDPES